MFFTLWEDNFNVTFINFIKIYEFFFPKTDQMIPCIKRKKETDKKKKKKC